MQNRFLFVIAAIVGLLPNVLLPNLAEAVPFFSEDFENLGATPLTPMTPDLTASGWVISNTAATVELEAEWILLDTAFLASSLGLPVGVQFGPATASGATTPAFESLPGGPPATVPGGFFIASLSDGTAPTADPPTHPGGVIFESEIRNATYSGASNDIITPSFSTVGATGDVWFHADMAINLNDNGQAIFDIDVSTDGGTTWVNKFRRIAPGTGRNIASGDFDSDVDVDGRDFLLMQRAYDESDDLTDNENNITGDPPPDGLPDDIERNRRNSTQRFSDWSKSLQGAYTPVVATVAAGNAGGVHGPLDLNLGAAVGGQPDVKIRFRQFETRDDEFLTIDNIVVDEVVPAGSEAIEIFAEDFNDLSLGLNSMGVYPFAGQLAPILVTFDTGGAGFPTTISGNSWGAQDRNSIDPDGAGPETARYPNGRYTQGVGGSRGGNNLGHPTAEGVNGEVPFAIVDAQAEADGPTANVTSERLHTPILDFTTHSIIILEWDDEAVFNGNPIAGSIKSIVLMEDSGPGGIPDGIPNAFDIMLNQPNKQAGGNTSFEPYTPYDQFAGGAFAGGSDPIFGRRRLDISADVAGRDDIYIAFQFVAGSTALGNDFEYWAVDNIRITGNGIPLSALTAAIPEPSSLLLALVGLPVFGAFRRRRPIG